MQWKQMTARTIGDVVVIDLVGSMCLCGDDELPALIVHLLDQGSTQFVLNCLRVPYIDSSGLDGMVRAFTAVVRRGGTLKLLHLHQRVQRLLEITRLASTFEVFGSEEEAVRSFKSNIMKSSKRQAQD